jgi:hypothetical protein
VVVGRKPSKVTRTSYRPAGIRSNRKVPVSSVRTEETLVPAGVLNSTSADVSTPPVESMTVPVTVDPLGACAAPTACCEKSIDTAAAAASEPGRRRKRRTNEVYD